MAVIELSAGGAIPTVRHTSQRVVQRLDAKLIQINRREENVPSGHISLPMGAAESIKIICDCAASLAEGQNRNVETR